MGVGVGMCASVGKGYVEVSIVGVGSLHPAESRDQILVVRLDGKHLCSLSYLASPNYILILINRKFSENSINCSL